MSLREAFEWAAGAEHRYLMRQVDRMAFFAQGGPALYGEFKAWSRACDAAGELLDPAPFKKSKQSPAEPAPQ